MSPAPPPRTRVRPNRNTLGLVAVLLGMWYAGVTQNNGAAYLLCFVLAGVALVSIAHAWANLRGLRVEAHVPRAAFAGEHLLVSLRVASGRRGEHDAIRVTSVSGGETLHLPLIPAEGAAEGELAARAEKRGLFPTLTLRVESRYPLGFFTARSVHTIAARHLIYPRPAGELPLPIRPTPARAGSGGPRAEGDDFAGVRTWRVGESQRHIDWKAVARGQPLLIKEWSGDADTTVRLDLEALGHLPFEARLSQLARWIITAEQTGHLYALHLPGAVLPAARGDAHFHECLRRLATCREEGGA